MASIADDPKEVGPTPTLTDHILLLKGLLFGVITYCFAGSYYDSIESTEYIR